MRINNNNSTKTADIALAAFLQANNQPILSLDKTNPKRVEFVFAETDAISKLIDAYYTGNATIDPKVLYFHLKDIKSRMLMTK